MSDDWTEMLPDWGLYVEHVRREMVPKLRRSAYVMSLVPEGDADLKFAIELGMSIMLDKPIIAVVRPGTKMPERLVRVADEIIEADITTDAGRRDLMTRIQAAMERIAPR